MNKITYLVITVICFSFFASGCGNKTTKVEGMELPRQETKATSVEVVNAQKELIEDKYMFNGTIKPENEVSVLSTLSNVKVKTVNYNVGDKVNAGDVLFTLDTTDIENNIKVLEASLASAEASIQSAETNLEFANGSSVQTQIENAKNTITSAEKTMQSSELTLNTAKTDYENGKVLFDVGGISQSALDNYKTAYDNAQIAYDKALDTYNQAKTSYDILVNQTLEENVRKAEDSLNVAKASKQSIFAQMASYQKSLNDAKVTSPISGTVSECNVTAGAMLSQSTPFVIVNLDTVKLEVNVSEQLIPYVKQGSQVEIKVTALSNDLFSGIVSTVSPVANSDGTYAVTIEIDNSDESLKSGMFAEVYFVKEKSEDSIVLDRSAVLTKGDEQYVFANENSIAKKVIVTTGIDNGDKIQILSGLEENMSVVTSGNSYLKDGDALNIVSDLKEEEKEVDSESEASQQKEE